MHFKLEDISFDLGNTSYENIFLNDFMPYAEGNFVKVYLLAYKLAKEGSEVSNAHIADRLGLIESDVLRAFNYWQEQGIVNIYDDEIEFLNLKNLYIQNVYDLNSGVNKDFEGVISDPKIANLLTRAEHLLRKNLSASQKMEISSWISDYNMPIDLIEEAFFYSTEIRKKYDLKYVEGVIRKWAEKNIRTPEEVQRSYLEHEESYYRYNKVLRLIGFEKKAFSQVDFDIVNSWFKDLGFDFEMVELACRKTANIRNPNIGYVDAILRSWHKKNVKKPSDISKKDIKMRVIKPSAFKNFKQQSDSYSESELEEIAKKNRKKFLKNMGELDD